MPVGSELSEGLGRVDGVLEFFMLDFVGATIEYEGAKFELEPGSKQCLGPVLWPELFFGTPRFKLFIKDGFPTSFED